MADTEKETRQRANVIDAQSEALLRELDMRLQLETIRARKTGSELAGEHLGRFGGGYLCVLVIVYFASILYLPDAAISAVTGVVTLIVTSMIQLLKTVVGGSEPVDREPAEKGKG